MDENLFEIKVNDILEKAKAAVKKKLTESNKDASQPEQTEKPAIDNSIEQKQIDEKVSPKRRIKR